MLPARRGQVLHLLDIIADHLLDLSALPAFALLLLRSTFHDSQLNLLQFHLSRIEHPLPCLVTLEVLVFDPLNKVSLLTGPIDLLEHALFNLLQLGDAVFEHLCVFLDIVRS